MLKVWWLKFAFHCCLQIFPVSKSTPSPSMVFFELVPSHSSNTLQLSFYKSISGLLEPHVNQRTQSCVTSQERSSYCAHHKSLAYLGVCSYQARDGQHNDECQIDQKILSGEVPPHVGTDERYTKLHTIWRGL